MAGIALFMLLIVILAALTNGPQQAPVIVLPQVQTGSGHRGAVLFLVFLFTLVLLAEMVQRGG